LSEYSRAHQEGAPASPLKNTPVLCLPDEVVDRGTTNRVKAAREESLTKTLAGQVRIMGWKFVLHPNDNPNSQLLGCWTGSGPRDSEH